MSTGKIISRLHKKCKSAANIINKIRSYIYREYYRLFLPWLVDHRGGHTIDKYMEKLFLPYSEDDIEKRVKDAATIDDKPVFVKDLEFDNLIVLDACTYDEYVRMREKKDVEKRISSASVSEEFIDNNFRNKNWKDAVAVTSNPWYSKLNDEFHEIFRCYESEWSDKYRKVTSSSVTDRARTANKLFPEKRLVVHYMDPHGSYIDGDGEPVFSPSISHNVLQTGFFSNKRFIKCYRNNLRNVMNDVDELLEVLDGKTLITSDHGEFLGENNLYGHYYDNKSKALREVPLEVIEKD